MARSFGGSSYVQTALGAHGAAYAGFTFAAVCRITTDAPGTYQFMTGAGNFAYGLAVDTSAKMMLYNAFAWSVNAPAPTLAVAVADGWVIWCCTKVSGTTYLRYHKYTFSTRTWAHENSANTYANDTTVPTTALLYGQYVGATGSHPWKGDVAVSASWDATFTDGQVESLAGGLGAWFQAPPRYLHLFDQAATTTKVLDLTGRGANENGISGTTVSTGSVPWNRGVGPLVVSPPAVPVVPPSSLLVRPRRMLRAQSIR